MTLDTSNVRIHVCPLSLFEEQINEQGRREVRPPNEFEAAVLRWCFRDVLNLW